MFIDNSFSVELRIGKIAPLTIDLSLKYFDINEASIKFESLKKGLESSEYLVIVEGGFPLKGYTKDSGEIEGKNLFSLIK